MPLASVLHTLRAWDLALFFLINESLKNPLFDVLMPFITNKWNFVLPIALLFLYFLFWGGRRGKLIILSTVLLLLLADGSAAALKDLFHRARPCQELTDAHLLVGCTSSFAFPSNHATNAFALAALFAYHYRRLLTPLFLAAALVGYSRVYVGAHYPFDVLGGAVLGLALGLAIAAAGRRMLRRWDKGTP